MELLKRLLKKIDHQDNDIYLHIDRKSKLEQDLISNIEAACKYSQIKFVKRHQINWGGYSQINGELRLFEEAKKEKYDYYHILSGIDFSTKSMKYIHDFFERNRGYEFVHFCGEKFTKTCAERYEQYHLLQEYVGKKKSGILYLIERVLVKIQQKVLKINRAKRYSDITFKCGSNWCSLTDECFVQTILYNSTFKKNIFCKNGTSDEKIQCLRSVDWKRGDPYTYQESDYDELVRSGNLFCRKVSDKEPQYERLISKLELL